MNRKKLRWDEVLKLPGKTRVDFLRENLLKRGLVNSMKNVQCTNCGSQLVNMLEEFDKKYKNKYDWHSYDVIVHEDMHEGTCRATLSYLSEEFTDWLQEKNKRTYEGNQYIMDNRKHLNLNEVLYWIMFGFCNSRSAKGIKVYG